jgi:hypothetical protein
VAGWMNAVLVGCSTWLTVGQQVNPELLVVPTRQGCGCTYINRKRATPCRRPLTRSTTAGSYAVPAPAAAAASKQRQANAGAPCRPLQLRNAA